MEKILYNRLYNFCMSNKIISDYQCGGIEKRSTIPHIVYMIEKAHSFSMSNHASPSKGRASYEKCVIVLLDVSKAFDKVDRLLLLQKLLRSGVSMKFSNIIAAYLSERMQTTKVGTFESSPMKTTSGIPQGSALSMLLFIIYMNDVIENLNNVDVTLFVDNVGLIFYGKNAKQVMLTMSKILGTLHKWSRKNYIVFDSSKFQIIDISKYKIQHTN